MDDYRHGVDLERAGDFGAAAECYRRAAASGHLDALVQLGCLLSDQGNLAEAEAAFARADECGHAMGTSNLAALMYQRGDRARAELAFRRGADRGHGPAAGQLGAMLLERGDVSGALAAFEQAFELGESKAAYSIGFVLHERGDLSAAEAAYVRAEQAGEPFGAVGLARLSGERGDSSASERWMERAGELEYQRRRPEWWWRDRSLVELNDDERESVKAEMTSWHADLTRRLEADDGSDPVETEAIVAELRDLGELNRRAQADYATIQQRAESELEQARTQVEQATLRNGVTVRGARYLGGAILAPDETAGVVVQILPGAGVHVVAGDHVLFDLPWSRLDEIAVEGPDQVERRVTATRLVAVGLLALAIKKRQPVSYLVVRAGTTEAIFEVPLPLWELRAGVAPFARALGAPADGPAAVDPLDRLRKLGELRSAGVLTEEEFADQKAKILDS